MSCSPPRLPLLSPFQRQDDEKFLTDLFAQLTDETTDDDKRHELVTKSSLPFPDLFANFLSGPTAHPAVLISLCR